MTSLAGLTEQELNALVSFAIHRAELLDEDGSSAAGEAWHEVMIYEEALAALLSPAGVTGGVARVGAIAAALAAGRQGDAVRLRNQYLGEPSLPAERREAVERAFQENEARLARRFPTLARAGRLGEIVEWRAAVGHSRSIFPLVA